MQSTSPKLHVQRRAIVWTVALTLSVLALGCQKPDAPDPFPAPDAWGATTGPGLGSRTFAADALFTGCAALTGGPQDVEHHNLSSFDDGYLIHPWAPEDGGGGISVYDFADPCAPVKVGEAYSPFMRESHSLAFGTVRGRRYLAVDSINRAEGTSTPVTGGVGFWDITDASAPTWVGSVDVPGFYYPDAYVRVTLSTTWVGDVVYAPGGANGIYIIDATDPTAPTLHGTYQPDIPFIIGSLHAIGPLGIATSAGLSRVALLDLSDPWRPTLLPNGIFDAVDRDGARRTFYFSNVGDRYLFLARNARGGGPIIYDLDTLDDAGLPQWRSDHVTTDGDGGYVALHERWLFQGDSHFGSVYDVADINAPVEIGRFALRGDLDTVTPLGNVAQISVDAGAEPGLASVIMPWRAEPDARGPAVGLSRPADDAVFVAPTAAIGLLFDEAVEPRSVFAGSVRLSTAAGEPVAARFYTMDTVVNVVPDAPLAPDTTYLLTVPEGGVVDPSGNAVSTPFTARFSTGAVVDR